MAPKSNREAVEVTDITNLQSLLKGTSAHILTPPSEGYSKSIERWSRAAEKPAGVSIVPTTAEEVSIAIKYASEHNLDVAVKGGGHSTAGASSTHGGLLIDLGRMRNVTVDTGTKQLRIQGGALWADVDDAAWKHGLATVGGTVADTGVGGLTLGGGYGALSGERGLVIDNMLAATVVLANGDIVTASKTSNPDLFWALLGAGQNFGVTTEFVLQGYPQQDVYIGSLLYAPTPDNIRSVVEHVNDLFDSTKTGRAAIQGKGMALLGLVKPPEAGGNTLLLIVVSFNGTEAEAKQHLEPLLALKPIVNTLSAAPYPNINKQVPTQIGMRSSLKGAAFVLPIRPEFVSELQAKYEDFIAGCEDAAGSLVAWELFDPHTVANSEEGCFANRGYHLNSLIMPMWSQAGNDGKCRQWAREMSLMFKHELERHGQKTSSGVEGGASVRGNKGAVLLYGNYDVSCLWVLRVYAKLMMDVSQQYDEISKDIFGQNYPRLQALKAQYDPKNMFDKLFAITPAAANGAT